MITFITALYPEAKDLIHKLNLKKQPEETLYQLFEQEQVRLIITGTGMISAAAAVARHFAKYPSLSDSDLVVNIGVAGLVTAEPSAQFSTQVDLFPHAASTAGIGELFLVSKITEQATGRTFYPDLLYRHPFSLLPLLTVPTVCQEAFSAKEPPCFEETLLDMEASALYQTLLPHVSTNRMLFFKVISDIPGQTDTKALAPDKLLAPHVDSIIAYMEKLHRFLMDTTFVEPLLAAKERELSEKIQALLPMTETMSREYDRLLSYAKLANKPLECILAAFADSIKGTTIRGKKQAMPHLARLRELVLDADSLSSYKVATTDSAENTAISRMSDNPAIASDSTHVDNLYQPFFSTIYAEKEVWNDTLKETASFTPIIIDHYKDIFNRSHQDFAAQKQAPSLILAKKTGTLIYKGAPVCQSFGKEHFYYTSCMMNCIYHCDYCYLQGMYPSGHVVVFVNLEDYFKELEALLKEHPVYLCISYDTDLLALEQKFSFVSRWLAFASNHPDLTLEIRTKSGNAAVFDSLAALYLGKEQLQKQIIFAWTVSPEHLCRRVEHGAASLALRLKALQAAKQAGFSVRLCFDPMIVHGGWEKEYSTLVDTVFSTISADDLYDVSIGVFRISTDYLKNMRKKRPDSAIVQYPYITENGVSHYGTLSEKMVHYLQNLLLPYLPAEKIFLWNGGLE